VERVVADEVAAALAPRGGPGYGWWKALLNFFPNGPATHHARPRDRAALTQAVEALFISDAHYPTWPCTYCGRPAAVLWGKTGLQLVASERLVNTTPPGIAGWPACRPCRVAAHALLYGTALAPAVASVLTADDEAVERAFAFDCVRANLALLTATLADLPGRTEASEAAVVRVIRSLPRASGAAVLWTFKNANDPAQAVLRVDRLRAGSATFLVHLGVSAAAEAGWAVLVRRLTVTRRDGITTMRGSDAAARLLFYPETTGARHRADLVARAAALVRDQEPDCAEVQALGVLVRRFAEEVLAVTGDELERLALVAEGVAAYIAAASSRGRFQVFRQANRTWTLVRYLREVEADHLLTGRSAPSITTSAMNLLVAADQRGQTARDLLFFAVCERLPPGLVGGDEEEEEPPALAAQVLGDGAEESSEEEFA
jgi:CRISPR-associated protein Cst1